MSHLISSSRAAIACTALALAVSAVAPAPASAQPTDADLGDMATFVDLFPNARTAPAPAALVPGLRLSYQSAGAVIGSPGAASGGGIIQYDVVTRDARHILAHLHAYGDDGQGAYPVYGDAARGYPGIGPFWISPGLLRGADALGGGNLTVSRYDKQLASGETVAVVRFQTQTSNGRTVFEFDTASGLLVFNSVSGGPSAAQLTLVGVRQLSLPWAPGRAPNWVRPGASIAMSGVRATTIPSGGGGPIPQPIDIGFQVQAAGARWSIARVETRLNGQAQGQGPAATGQAQLLGALWVPQTALAAQLDPAGVRVDVDPHTGAEFYVARAEGGGVVLQQQTPVSQTTAVYHPTLGVLDRLVQEIHQPTAVVVTDVARDGGDDALSALAQQAPVPDDPGAVSGPGDLGGGGDSGGCAIGGGSPGGVASSFALLGWLVRRRRRR